MLGASVYAVPLVTLKHGGQLQGRSVTYDGKSVDIFLGSIIRMLRIENAALISHMILLCVDISVDLLVYNTAKPVIFLQCLDLGDEGYS